MAKKPNFKELLLKKGEKIGLIAAGAALVVFLLMGVQSMSGAVNPRDNEKKIETAQKTVETAINNPAGKTAELDKNLFLDNPFTPVSAADFQPRTMAFEPVTKPSSMRDNPIVLPPHESQVTFYAGSYKGYDRQFDGETGAILRVGVLRVASKDGGFDPGRLTNLLPQKKGGPKTRPGTPAPMNPMAPMPPQPGAPIAPPVASGGPPRPGMPLLPGKPTDANGEREDLIVEYKTFEDALKSGQPPARTIFPVRLAVVQMSFPYKAQLDEIKRSLRLPSLAAARHEASAATIDARSPRPAAAPGAPGGPPVAAPQVVSSNLPGAAAGSAAADNGDSPAFVGLVVERRVTGPDGQPSAWEEFDHQDRFFDRFTRFETPYVPEDGYWPYFLRPYQGLSSPLPVMAGAPANTYPPDVKLPSIYANYTKMLNDRLPKKTEEEMQKRFRKGDSNPYAPSATPAAPGAGGFGNEGVLPPGVVMPPGLNMPKRPGEAAPVPVAPGVPGAAVDPNKLEVEHLLLRFLDAELAPGFTYEYRVKVRMKNPNFNNKTMVGNESMAAEEILESAWYQVPDKVTVPPESHLYAYSAKRFEEHAKKMYDEAGRPPVLNRVLEVKDVQEGRKVVVQIQKWQERMFLPGGTSQEPIGAWIQAEMPVGPGEYIGRRWLCELPLWRSGVKDPKATKETSDPYTGAYVLPSPDAKTALIAPWPADSGANKYTLPKARIIDFRTPSVLIDFDGGRVTTRVGTATQTDDTAADLLILREDGKIEVRREAQDMAAANPPTARAVREKTWDEWLDRVRKTNEPDATGTAPGSSGFPNPRGGPATPTPPIR